MTADVYAADDDLPALEAPQLSTRSAAMQVSADAEPDVLCRIASLLNLLNTTPERVSFENWRMTRSINRQSGSSESRSLPQKYVQLGFIFLQRPTGSSDRRSVVEPSGFRPTS